MSPIWTSCKGEVRIGTIQKETQFIRGLSVWTTIPNLIEIC